MNSYNFKKGEIYFALSSYSFFVSGENLYVYIGIIGPTKHKFYHIKSNKIHELNELEASYMFD